MIFKDRKIPKHLIIQDEHEIRRRPRFNIVKIVFTALLVLALTYAMTLTAWANSFFMQGALFL